MRLQDQIFDQCVTLLQQAAELLGTDYNTINVVLFCGWLPALLFLLVSMLLYYRGQAHHYRMCWRLALVMAKARDSKAAGLESFLGRDK